MRTRGDERREGERIAERRGETGEGEGRREEGSVVTITSYRIHSPPTQPSTSQLRSSELGTDITSGG
eukprot:548153-Hanusia_phi.AAC.1